MSLRVLALVPHPETSASGRYRAYQMIPWLEESGVELEVRPFLDQRGFDRLYRRGRVVEKAWDLARGMRRRWRDLESARRYALVFVHREAWPLVGFAPDRWMERRGIGWVFDFDDAVFMPNVSEANRVFSRLKPFDQAARLAAGARAVAAGNAWLADWARRQRPGRPADDVEVIPSAVDTDVWRPRSREPGPPRLVWTGSLSTVRYLESLRPVLERLAGRHEGLELHVIGAPFEAGRIRVRTYPWSAETEAALVGGCDIGLAPLAADDWSRGKCGVKLLLYMALGLPAVASPVGVHAEIVSHGENGMLAAETEAFERALDTLLRDLSLRVRLGRAARETVESRYSLAAVAPRLAALLKRAAERI